MPALVQLLEPRVMLSASPIAVISQPVTVDEGQQVSLSAMGSYDPDGMSVMVNWDLNNDGSYWDAMGEWVMFDPSMQFPSTPNGTPATVRIQVNDWFDPPSYAETTVTVLNVAPTITDRSLTPSSVNLGESLSLSAWFNDPGMADTLTYSLDWGDGTNPETGSAMRGQFTRSWMFTTPGDHTVSLALTDNDGGTVTWSETIHVNDLSFATPAFPPEVDENTNFSLVLATTFPANIDSWTVTWNHGHETETPDYVTYPGNSGILAANHFYPDDNPTESPEDEYQVTIVAYAYGRQYDVTPEGQPLTITVRNVAPTWTTQPSLPPTPIDPGGFVSFSGQITDQGMSDTHTYEINWGDGSDPETGNVAGGSFGSPMHVYSEPGTYEIQVTVRDDDGGVLTLPSPMQVIVNPWPTIGIVASDPNAAEYESQAAGPTDGTFTLTRVGSLSNSVTVTYSIAGSAANGTDYYGGPMMPLISSVTFDAWETTKTITVHPINDYIDEEDETVLLTLQSGFGYQITSGADSATVTIADAPPDPVAIEWGTLSGFAPEGNHLNFAFDIIVAQGMSATIAIDIDQDGQFDHSVEYDSDYGGAVIENV